ncbi:hypothetical protein BGZ76_008626 [Entomortierella beljakovae]|nr:hypothetical protein BGZ76_008626 [Entomortierella beljakovae]
MTSRVPIRQDRSLLNPKFEGYKLSFLEESHQHFVSVGAPGPGVVIPKLPLSAKLSYRQVQARIRHNHLYPGWNSQRTPNGDISTIRSNVLFVIDGDFALVALQFDKASKILRSKKLLQIPRPVAPINFCLEFPIVQPVSPDLILVSDGASTFYLVRLLFNGLEYEAAIVATTRFQPDNSLASEDLTPCQLLEAKAFPIMTGNNEQATEIKFIVCYASNEDFYSSEPSPHRKSDKKTIFIISLCSMVWTGSSSKSATSNTTTTDMDMDVESSQPLENKTIHSIRGTDVPSYCALDPSNEGYVIGSFSAYKPTKDPVVEQKTRYLEPGSEAMDLDGTDIGVKPSDPPYIWTQTDSDVTVCFGLPKGTTKHSVYCKFTRQGLELHVNLSQPTDQAVRLPDIDKMPLFDLVQPDECFWTLESATGVLTITLEKKNTKTRWTQIFDEGADLDPVAETLDPSVFAEYKSALEKYTTENSGGGPGRDSTLLPSLTQDPQEDIDEEGEDIKLSWIQSEDGVDIIRAATIGTGHDWIGQAFPCFDVRQGERTNFSMPSICLKHDVDGLVYAVQHVPGSTPSQSSIQQDNGVMRFDHVSTFDALAFVQASKREKKFVLHDPHGRFCVIAESSRNVYIYWHTANASLSNERQTVVDVSKGRHVDVIGCQLIDDGVLVVLMEGQHGALVLELGQV